MRLPPQHNIHTIATTSCYYPSQEQEKHQYRSIPKAYPPTAPVFRFRLRLVILLIRLSHKHEHEIIIIIRTRITVVIVTILVQRSFPPSPVCSSRGPLALQKLQFFIVHASPRTSTPSIRPKSTQQHPPCIK